MAIRPGEKLSKLGGGNIPNPWTAVARPKANFVNETIKLPIAFTDVLNVSTLLSICTVYFVENIVLLLMYHVW